MKTMTDRPAKADKARRESPTPSDSALVGQPAGLLLAFTIGALVGVGLAVTWIPRRPKSRPQPRVVRGYHRAREAGSSALREGRRLGAELTSEFREELAANIEAAREELVDVARKQVKKTRRALQREYSKYIG